MSRAIVLFLGSVYVEEVALVDTAGLAIPISRVIFAASLLTASAPPIQSGEDISVKLETPAIGPAVDATAMEPEALMQADAEGVFPLDRRTFDPDDGSPPPPPPPLLFTLLPLPLLLCRLRCFFFRAADP